MIQATQGIPPTARALEAKDLQKESGASFADFMQKTQSQKEDLPERAGLAHEDLRGIKPQRERDLSARENKRAKIEPRDKESHDDFAASELAERKDISAAQPEKAAQSSAFERAGSIQIQTRANTAAAQNTQQANAQAEGPAPALQGQFKATSLNFGGPAGATTSISPGLLQNQGAEGLSGRFLGMDMPGEVQVQWNVEQGGQTAPHQVNQAEDSAWNLWTARLQGQGAPAEDAGLFAPVAEGQTFVQTVVEGSGGLLTENLNLAKGQGTSLQSGFAGSGNGESGTNAQSGQRGLEFSATPADVQGGAGSSSSATPLSARVREAAAAIREKVQIQKPDAEGNASAKLEVKVGDERLLIEVRMKNGRVDVDVKGMDPSELARLREELGPEMERQKLSLGDFKSDDGSSQNQGFEEDPASALEKELQLESTAKRREVRVRSAATETATPVAHNEPGLLSLKA